MLTLQEICLSVQNGELKQTLGAMSSMLNKSAWAPCSKAYLITKRFKKKKKKTKLLTSTKRHKKKKKKKWLRERIGKVVDQEGVYCTGTKLPTMGAACLTMFSTKMKRDSASNSSPAVTWISSICFKISSSLYPFGTLMISNSTACCLDPSASMLAILFYTKQGKAKKTSGFYAERDVLPDQTLGWVEDREIKMARVLCFSFYVAKL